MKTLPVALSLGAALAALPAQTTLLLPATANPAMELNSYAIEPFMQTNARVQMFYDATETGSPAFLANGLQLRYDGPIPQVGAPGPFTIQRLQIRVGVSTVAQPDARFASNLTQPLTTVYDGPWTLRPDPGTAFPHPWGGVAGALTFPFAVPVQVAIPAGGWFVVELAMTNNNIANFGYAHVIVDGANTTGGPADGTVAAFGQGCGSGSGPAPTIGSAGTRAPGGAVFVAGAGLGSNALVFSITGLSNTANGSTPLPYALPGTGCQLLVSTDAVGFLLANAAGAIEEGAAGTGFAIPADPAFAGVALHQQLAAYAPGANPFDAVFSNAQTVTLGGFGQPGRGTYAVIHGGDAAAEVATVVRAFGFALRVTTL